MLCGGVKCYGKVPALVVGQAPLAGRTEPSHAEPPPNGNTIVLDQIIRCEPLGGLIY